MSEFGEVGEKMGVRCWGWVVRCRMMVAGCA